LGNFFLVREVRKKVPPLVLRFFLLSTHYRSPLDFDEDKVAAARKGWERLKNSYLAVGEALRLRTLRPPASNRDREFLENIRRLRRQFEEAMDDDFNTALAIAFCFDLAREANTYLNQETVPAEDVLRQTRDLFVDFGSVLGLFKIRDGEISVSEEEREEHSELVGPLVELLLQVRQEARSKKEWAMADRIRDGLKELGIIVEDTPQGARWKRAPRI
ncbi:MAG: DALR domain-containing protein, partial [Desulfotomaculales bacterium]